MRIQRRGRRGLAVVTASLMLSLVADRRGRRRPKVHPHSGPPGTTIEVVGAGFPDTTCPMVMISFVDSAGTTTRLKRVSDPGGSFDVMTTIPADASIGRGVIEAEHLIFFNRGCHRDHNRSPPLRLRSQRVTGSLGDIRERWRTPALVARSIRVGADFPSAPWLRWASSARCLPDGMRRGGLKRKPALSSTDDRAPGNAFATLRACGCITRGVQILRHASYL
jgi:hypothetical protein